VSRTYPSFYKWGQRLYKTARFIRPAQLLCCVKDHMNLFSLGKEICCCRVIWSYKKTDFYVKQKTLINGRKRGDHVVPSFCNLFYYPICWLILPEWTLDGLERSHETSGKLYLRKGGWSQACGSLFAALVIG